MLAPLSGCSDPETRVFPADTKVVLRPAKGEDVGVWIGGDGKGRWKKIDIPSGSRALVVDDREAEPPVQPSLRLVRVRLADGANEGLVVELSRYLVEEAP